MRKSIMFLTIAVLVATALPSFAELQNVEVGGEIRLRGNYISNVFIPGQLGAVAEPRWGANAPWPWTGSPFGAAAIAGRSMGGPFGPNVMSIFDWDDRGGDLKFVEQRTRVNIKADFTDEVSAFIELDSYDWWGETAVVPGAVGNDFRSANYVTGADARANTGDDVEVFQAYIEANEMFGQPVRLRIGRQEMAFGSQFLVGTGDFGFFFTGLSFDAIRLTYATDQFSVDAWGAKLVERSPIEEDGDVDFYGIYASYLGLEDITLDAYWMWLRDARAINVNQLPFMGEWIEGILDLDQYDTTSLHTVGLRGAGKVGAFDFDAELAYQFGDAGQIGSTFVGGVWPTGQIYGDEGADFDEWGGCVEVGYAFDMQYQPRVFLGAMYFGGEDDRDVSFLEWLFPFINRPEASVSFNRLFSNQIYSGALDLTNDLSNVLIIRGGVQAAITEKLFVWACLSYFEALEEFDAPVHFKIRRLRIPVAPAWPWWTQENDDDLGWETDFFFNYMYSEDLTFEFGWAHFFVGDGAAEGNYVRWNGLLFNGGTDDEDADYVYFGTSIKF